MAEGFEYNGYWIQDYEHQFGERRIVVWRVLTRQGGPIVKKHLPSEKDAKEWVDANPRKSNE
jgi:hypothetical protein